MKSGKLKYIINEKGVKIYVLVPLKTRKKINDDYARLKNKLNLFFGIKNGLREIKEAKKTGKKLQTLNDFVSKLPF